MNEALTAAQIKEVKGRGFLLNRGTRNFSARVVTGNGTLSAEQLHALAEAAQRFGSGSVAFTVRLTVEVPGIPYEAIEPFCAFLKPYGLETGGTGNRVRPIVACKGTSCVFGLYDTQALAAEMHEKLYQRYFGLTLPHKFKIAVGGCPNNCAKPDLNDLGFVGALQMNYAVDICRGCASCGVVKSCPMKAASVIDGKLTIDRTRCNDCGRCLGQCPFHVADEGEKRLKVYVGGKWGKNPRVATPLSRLCRVEDAVAVAERAILFYKEQGQAGERFGDTIDRVGIEAAEKAILGE